MENKSKSVSETIKEILEIDEEEFKNDKKKKSKYLVSKEEAYEIADLDENLKSDFCRNSNRKGISFMAFNEKKINLVRMNNKKYWLIEITDGDISQIKFDRHGNEIFLDGSFTKNELKKLRCLINVDTGEYIYYPKKESFFNIFKKNKDMQMENIDE